MSDSPTRSDPRLAVRGLTVAFGGLTALDEVSFDVGPGEIVALIGPNGAGKTTVFNAVCGLVRPRSGSIRIDGRPAPRAVHLLVRRGVSRTLQGLGLVGGMSALQNVLVPLAASRALRPADTATALAQLRTLGLGDAAHRTIDALPYPERKRVALARALVTDPALLLLDEPAGGLGAEDIARLAETIRAASERGCAVLLVEHHVDFVMEVADRIVVLDFGRVIARGTPAQIQSDPRVEEAYLGMAAAS